MSGKTIDLVNACTSAAPLRINGRAGFRRAFRDLLKLFLGSQYVVKSKDNLDVDSLAHHVVIGSGMGLIMSGPISDYSFYVLAESGFLLDPAVRERHHIRTYMRFKDDLFLVVGGDAASRRAFYYELQRRAAYFKLKVDCISATAVEMLDLIIYKGNYWQHHGILDYRVRIRTTALVVCLSDTSMHHTNVHRTWPLARIGTIRKRCSTVHLANVAVTEFKDVLTSRCPSHVALKILDLGSGFPAPVRPLCTISSSWLVLPHHPIWEKGGLSAKLVKIFTKWLPSLEKAGENISDLRCRIAWSLGGTCLKSRILKCNSEGGR